MDYKTIKEIVVSKLRAEILSGKLPPGQELTVKTLSHRFSCSMTPIREALRTLEGEGLVGANRHRSVAVTKLDITEVEEIFEVRAILEGHAANLAVSKIDPKVLDNLRENILKQETFNKTKNYIKWFELNFEFHNEIYKCAKQSVLLESINTLRNRTTHYVKTYTVLLDRSDRATSEHKEILNAISMKDGSLASELTKKHLGNLARDLGKFIRGKREMTIDQP